MQTGLKPRYYTINGPKEKKQSNIIKLFLQIGACDNLLQDCKVCDEGCNTPVLTPFAFKQMM